MGSAFITLKNKASVAQLRYFTPFIENEHFRVLTFKAVDIFHSLVQKTCISGCLPLRQLRYFTP